MKSMFTDAEGAVQSVKLLAHTADPPVSIDRETGGILVKIASVDAVNIEMPWAASTPDEIEVAITTEATALAAESTPFLWALLRADDDNDDYIYIGANPAICGQRLIAGQTFQIPSLGIVAHDLEDWYVKSESGTQGATLIYVTKD